MSKFAESSLWYSTIANAQSGLTYRPPRAIASTYGKGASVPGRGMSSDCGASGAAGAGAESALPEEPVSCAFRGAGLPDA